MRVGDSTEETAEVTRLLALGTQMVKDYLRGEFPSAPDVIVNEAVIRLAGYLYDQPTSGRGDAFANALRSSGAARILLPHRVHRAGSTGAVQEVQPASDGLTFTEVSRQTLSIATTGQWLATTLMLPYGASVFGVQMTYPGGLESSIEIYQLSILETETAGDTVAIPDGAEVGLARDPNGGVLIAAAVAGEYTVVIYEVG